MRGLTKKFDYEKGRRQKNTQNPDYHERLQDEGDKFDRGGKQEPKLISFQRSTLVLDMRPFFQDDKQSLLATLEHNWKFTIDGQVGTISQLRKNPKVSEKVEELFAIMKNSVLRAVDIIGYPEHPKTKRPYRMVEFRCNIRPVEPFPNPVFKKHLAFSVKLVGPALTSS
jgi:hypothetical protein